MMMMMNYNYKCKPYFPNCVRIVHYFLPRRFCCVHCRLMFIVGCRHQFEDQLQKHQQEMDEMERRLAGVNREQTESANHIATLEEAVEAERSSHFQTKFSCELLQVRLMKYPVRKFSLLLLFFTRGNPLVDQNLTASSKHCFVVQPALACRHQEKHRAAKQN